MRIDLSMIQAIANIEDRKAKVYEAAKYYASQGIPVIPIPYGQKHVNSGSIYTNKCSIRATKIEEWFNPIKGRYAGYNVALGCGDYFGKGGIFAVDVDNKYKEKYGKDSWGPEAWAELVHENGSVYGPVQATPSGGMHIIAMWQENLTPSQDKIALGIDTRGGHPGKISSHIMAFPSVVDGVEYEWKSGGEVMAPPQWLHEKMGVAWRKTGTGSRGNEMLNGDDVETYVPMDKVKSILFSIDPNNLSYEEWLRCGQAIHSQHNTKEALDLWDEWSQQGDRYEDGECRVRWRGFKEHGPVRMATLFYIAQNKGTAAQASEEDAGSDEGFLSDVVDEYNDQYALVLSGEKAKIIRKEVDIEHGQTIYSHYMVDAFRTFLQNDIIVVEDGKGEQKKIKKFDIWMASQRRRTFDGMMMRPDKPKVIQLGQHQYLNTWAGFAVKAEEGDWSLLKQHMLDNLCVGNKGHYEWLMDWMADMFQEPADPKGCAVVLGGIEGAGKGTLANAIAHIFGIHGTIISNSDHLTSKFNGMIMDSVFLFADEVIYAGNHDAANRLKAMVTEKSNTREQKFGDQKKVRNFLHIMMATNNDWKVAAGPESRRWFILQVASKPANDVAYFKAIRDQLHNGGYEAMLHELLGRTITSNLRFAPVTAELKKQRTLLQVQSLSESFPSWIAYLVDTGNLGVHDVKADMANEGMGWPEVVGKSKLWEAYAEWVRKFKPKATALATPVFYAKLYEMGFTEGARVRLGNARERTIVVPPFEKMTASAEKIYSLTSTDAQDQTEDAKNDQQ